MAPFEVDPLQTEALLVAELEDLLSNLADVELFGLFAESFGLHVVEAGCPFPQVLGPPAAAAGHQAEEVGTGLFHLTAELADGPEQHALDGRRVVLMLL